MYGIGEKVFAAPDQVATTSAAVWIAGDPLEQILDGFIVHNQTGTARTFDILVGSTVIFNDVPLAANAILTFEVQRIIPPNTAVSIRADSGSAVVFMVNVRRHG